MFRLNRECRNDIKYNLKQDYPNEGVLFIDLMPTFMDIKLMNKLADTIVEAVESLDIDTVIAPESRGYILGTLVAHKLNANVIPVRKHGKLPEDFIQGSYTYDTEYSTATLDLPKCDLKDKNCLFVDDVYALGGTYYACKRLVELAGGKVFGGACIYNVELNDNPEITSFLFPEDLDRSNIL